MSNVITENIIHDALGHEWRRYFFRNCRGLQSRFFYCSKCDMVKLLYYQGMDFDDDLKNNKHVFVGAFHFNKTLGGDLSEMIVPPYSCKEYRLKCLML